MPTNLNKFGLRSLGLLLLVLPGLALAIPPLPSYFEFSTCGATGATGPSQGDCDTAYTASRITSYNVCYTKLLRTEDVGTVSGASSRNTSRSNHR